MPDRIDRQKVAYNQRRSGKHQSLRSLRASQIDDLHVVIVPFYGEREAALNIVICTCQRRPQCTTRQHGFLLLVKADSAELLPVANKLIFHNEVVYGKLTLTTVSVNQQENVADSHRVTIRSEHVSAQPFPCCLGISLLFVASSRLVWPYWQRHDHTPSNFVQTTSQPGQARYLSSFAYVP